MNATQQRILMFLVKENSATIRVLRETIGVCESSIKHDTKVLMDEGYITLEIGKFKRHIFQITNEGILAGKRLIRYQSTEGEVVKAPSINKMLGTYVPSTGYQRNNGRDLRIGVCV